MYLADSMAVQHGARVHLPGVSYTIKCTPELEALSISLTLENE